LGERQGRAFTQLPAGASAVARYGDGALAAILRPVGAGRVLSFAGDTMRPRALINPLDLVSLVGAVVQWRGAKLGDPAWRYTIPGDPYTGRLPWQGAYAASP